MKRMIQFFDTTLRDGEQTPQVNLNLREKLEIAKQLAVLGVDTIEAGFPNASKGDFEAVSAVAKEVRDVSVAGLCRSVPVDIQRAWEALKYAQQPCLHVFIATSEVHMEYKLKMTEEEVLDAAVMSVKLAKSFCSDVVFSPEDASRSNLDFLYRVIEKTIQAGATVINIPDTVGFSTPMEFSGLIRNIFANVPNISKAQIAVHCHNDLGMAVANSLAAVEAGATIVQCTVNGMGERAGNASLEEIVMALQTRQDYFDVEHHIDTTQIYRTSTLVSNYMGIDLQPNKPIVGANAFRHESGIHQHGVLNNPLTYEILTPESVGIFKNESMVLGKLSGCHAFEEKIKTLGYHLQEEDLQKAFARFKELADRKKDVSIRDITAILDGKMTDIPAIYEIVDYQIFSGNRKSSTASIILKKGEEELQDAAVGEGPVDAGFNAIDKIVQLPVSLESYSLKSVTEGKDALGEVTVRVKYEDEVYLGKGISTNIIEASMLSYITALNRILAEKALNNHQ